MPTEKKPLAMDAPNSNPMQLETNFTNHYEDQNLAASTTTKRQQTQKLRKKQCPTHSILLPNTVSTGFHCNLCALKKKTIVRKKYSE